MYTYKLMKDPVTGNQTNVIKRSDGASVPIDPLNTDYQQYLLWLEEGNIPEDAD